MKVSLTIPVLAAAAALLLSAGAMAGPVYKWVDAGGGFHFSDTPQPGWKRVDLNNATVVSAEIPQAAIDEDEEKKAALCKQKRDELAGYKTAAKIVERDPLGAEREYNAEQKQKLIALTEQKVLEACGESEQESEP